jgi:putative addiction module component (TIGR02574 family)
MARHGIDLEALSPQEQLDLLDRLWERLGRNPDLFPLTDQQRRELDARSDQLDRDLSAGRPAGIPWEEVLTRIESH